MTVFPHYFYVDFADWFISSVKDKSKTQTLRYNFPDWISIGDVLLCTDEDGNLFAKAVVTGVSSGSLESFVNSEFEGHQSYENVDELCEAMSQHYEATFTAETELLFLEFEVFTVIN